MGFLEKIKSALASFSEEDQGVVEERLEGPFHPDGLAARMPKIYTAKAKRAEGDDERWQEDIREMGQIDHSSLTDPRSLNYMWSNNVLFSQNDDFLSKSHDDDLFSDFNSNDY